MKLSIVISTQPATFNALAYKGKVAENIEKVRKLGYDGVELAVRDPRLLDLAVVKALTIDTGFPVSALGTGQAFGEEGLSFSSPDRTIRRKAIERIKSHIDVAAQLNAIVIIGLIRGIVKPGDDPEQAEAWIIEALDTCAAVNPDVKLVIEPCNRYEANTVNTVGEGMALVDKLGRANVGLLLDTFHMNIEEPDMLESIENAGQRLFHFHIADSNRWYPGAGHIDFQAVCWKLSQIGYAGFLSAEILPLPDADTAAEMTIHTMRNLENIKK
ncbi:MAG: 5-keto-L-gluconate epimerase [Fidelibacterota bacterium]